MRILAPILLVCLSAALISAVRPSAPADKQADFDALLNQTKVAMDTGRYKDAKEILVTKLAEHKDAAYVKDKLDAIRADVKTCSFCIAYLEKTYDAKADLPEWLR